MPVVECNDRGSRRPTRLSGRAQAGTKRGLPLTLAVSMSAGRRWTHGRTIALGLVAIASLAGCANSSSTLPLHAKRTTSHGTISLPVGFPKSLSIPSGFYPVEVHTGVSSGFGVRFSYPQTMTSEAANILFGQSLAAQGWEVVPLGTTNSVGPMSADFWGFGMRGHFSIIQGAAAVIDLTIGPCADPCPR
jgi:hypothetical protein